MPKPVLKPHQMRALEVVADEDFKLAEYGTGTGKTGIIIKACELLILRGEAPILIVMPNSVLEQAHEEFETWLGPKWTRRHVIVLGRYYTIDQRCTYLQHGRSSVYILSTEALSYPKIRAAIRNRLWAGSFIDEASRFRNYSKRTLTLKALGSRSVTRYAFTGNLTVNRPADCFYITDFLCPGMWGTRSRDAFIKKYFVLGGFTGTEPMYLKPELYADFMAKLNWIKITAELKDVRDLPPRVMTVRRTALSEAQRKAYAQMRDELRIEIERTSDLDFASYASTYAVRLLRLQEICSGFARNVDGEVEFLPCPKTGEMIEALQDEPTTPSIIWYWFKPEGEIIKRALARAGLPYVWFGDKGARQAFLKGEVPIFLSQTAKGGFGLNLTPAERMFYHSLPWDLDVYTQSQERNMRLNTPDPKRGSLEVVHMITEDTCEEYVRGKLMSKAGMSRQFSKSQALELLRE